MSRHSRNFIKAAGRLNLLTRARGAGGLLAGGGVVGAASMVPGFVKEQVSPWYNAAIQAPNLGPDDPLGQLTSEQGYAAATAEIDKALSNMKPAQRMFARMDPTLAFTEVERHRPGSIKKWQQDVGRNFRPGAGAKLHGWFSGSYWDPTAGKLIQRTQKA